MGFSLDRDGFEIVPSLLSKTEIDDLRAALGSLEVSPGCRNLMRQVPAVANLAGSSKILGLLNALLGTEPFPVRSIFFDKTPEANWLVLWQK